MTRQNKGIAWLVSPFVLMIGSMLLYAVVNGAFDGAAEGSTLATAEPVVNLIISLIGFLGTLDFFVGIPVGIYFLATQDKKVH